MTSFETAWRTLDRQRHFIIPDNTPRSPGPLELASIDGITAEVDPAWAARYEVSEAEAHQWAREEFGRMLDELRERVDAGLDRARSALEVAKHTPVDENSDISPDAVPAMFGLLKALPGAVFDGVSGNPSRVMQANGRLSKVERRLNRAGIDVGAKLGEFPFRLAGLRRKFEAVRDPRRD